MSHLSAAVYGPMVRVTVGILLALILTVTLSLTAARSVAYTLNKIK